jgi:riboflavin synthase
MFTGIIETMGKVAEVSRASQGGRLWVHVGPLAKELRVGDSLSIDGVCLTVVAVKGDVVNFDVSQETFKRSTLGELRPGDKVNIERALRVGDRLGGHFVQGHVDGTAAIKKKEEGQGQCTMWFSVGKELSQNMLEKGSVAVDGVSLTVVDIAPSVFSVVLIPHTLTNTTLGLKKIGDRVNIETDILGKWVRRLQAAWTGREEGLTQEVLRAKGFE